MSNATLNIVNRIILTLIIE